MKTLALALATTAITATTALASADITSVDRNSDRFASFDEITAVYPGLTRSDFNSIDTNDDRRVSAVELADGAAQSIIHRQLPGQGRVLGLSKVDTNGDNFVSFTELAGVYRGLTASDWDKLDTNDDKRLNASELYSEAAQSVLGRHPAERRAFVSLNALDTDASGFATFGELTGTYPRLSTLDFHQIDLNGDKRISFDELYNADVRTVLSRAGN